MRTFHLVLFFRAGEPLDTYSVPLSWLRLLPPATGIISSSARLGERAEISATASIKRELSQLFQAASQQSRCFMLYRPPTRDRRFQRPKIDPLSTRSQRRTKNTHANGSNRAPVCTPVANFKALRAEGTSPRVSPSDRVTHIKQKNRLRVQHSRMVVGSVTA